MALSSSVNCIQPLKVDVDFSMTELLSGRNETNDEALQGTEQVREYMFHILSSI